MTITAPTVNTQTAAPVAAAPARTLGIVSLSLGIVALISGANPVLGAAALVVGILGYRREPAGKNFSIAGIVMGGISVAGVALGVAGFLAFLPFAGFLIPAFL